MQFQLVILKITLSEEIYYFLLLKELGNPMKGLINIQNEDNECFRWCLVTYLNPVNENPAKIKNVDEEYAKQSDLKGSNFLFIKKVMLK